MSEKTANPVRGEVTIDLPGHERYVLRPTFDALVQIEAELGEKIIPLAMSLAGLREAAVIIHRCGQAAGGKLTFAQIKELVMQAGLVALLPHLRAMLNLALTPADPNGEAVTDQVTTQTT